VLAVELAVPVLLVKLVPEPGGEALRAKPIRDVVRLLAGAVPRPEDG
jgi:hypothetical protein